MGDLQKRKAVYKETWSVPHSVTQTLHIPHKTTPRLRCLSSDCCGLKIQRYRTLQMQHCFRNQAISSYMFCFPQNWKVFSANKPPAGTGRRQSKVTVYLNETDHYFFLQSKIEMLKRIQGRRLLITGSMRFCVTRMAYFVLPEKEKWWKLHVNITSKGLAFKFLSKSTGILSAKHT